MAMADFLNTFNNPTGGVQHQQSPISPASVAPSPAELATAKAAKNEKLAMMLHALGGALKGDKDFVKNTMALQNMQEGKKKQDAQKAKHQKFLSTLPDGSFKDLATAMGFDKLDSLLFKKFEMDAAIPKVGTAAQQNYAALQEIKNTGSAEEIALAEKVFAGINNGKSTDQMLREAAASLSKTVNTYSGRLYTSEEIEQQLGSLRSIFGTLSQQGSQSSKSKLYSVTNPAYSDTSANDIILDAVKENPGIDRDIVVQELVNAGLIAES